MGQSDIDMTLASYCLIDQYRCSWEVLNGHGTSDHSLIVIKLSAVVDKVITNRVQIPRWNLKEADWVNYVSYVLSYGMKICTGILIGF